MRNAVIGVDFRLRIGNENRGEKIERLAAGEIRRLRPPRLPDFDGGGGVIGLDNSSQMKNLTVELLKRGWTVEELKAFWGGNLLRVWKACEDYAAQWKASHE